MSVYLHDIPLDQARSLFFGYLARENCFPTTDQEKLDLTENALGRILAESVRARISSPHYHASAMDGFAVISMQTKDADTNHPICLNQPNQFQYVDTGDELPVWADAVIPIELIEPIGLALDQNLRQADAIQIRASVVPWTHVRKVGEDVIASQLLLNAGQRLSPVDLATMAAAGHDHVQVRIPPRIAILPTGTELIPIGQDPKPGEIIEFNSLLLAGQIKEWGGIPQKYPICMDSFEAIKDNLLQAAEECDVVLINAGSSAGSEDYTADVLKDCGELFVHGIAVRPGHPVILGVIPKPNCAMKTIIPVIGVPGYPVSAAMTGMLFVKPLIEKWLGIESITEETLQATLTQKITSSAGDDEFIRMQLGKVKGRWLAMPLAKGAGMIRSLMLADCIHIAARGIQGIDSEKIISVNLLRPQKSLERSIVSIGSHDFTQEIIAEALAEKGVRWLSANVGSLAGILAFRKGNCHISGIHLLDEQSGEYNISYVEKYLPDQNYRLMHWAKREQGLIVKKGNPKRIMSLKDLASDPIRFMNRQRGSGTRILLDYHLSQLGIATNQVKGYEQEDFTHLGAALAVQSGLADCALGVYAAAEILGLDFIPLFNETYDFLMLNQEDDRNELDEFYRLLENRSFRQRLSTLGGYTFDSLGEFVL
jgi:putative molybdopterin biosynthesis protein